MHLTMHLNYDNDDNVMFAEHKKKLWRLMVVVAATISSSLNVGLVSGVAGCAYVSVSILVGFYFSPLSPSVCFCSVILNETTA